MRKSALIVLAFLIGGCASGRSDIAPSGPPDWRTIATPKDRERMRGLRSAWTEALGKARAGGHAAEIAKEGALLDPDAGLPDPALGPGDYRCRTIKLGARSRGLLDYVAYQPFQCRVADEGGVLSFQKATGSQRPIGLVFPDADGRMIFLGTLQLGDEAEALEYGTDQERDLIAAVERVGETRWRLAFPYPHFESVLDVIELVPAS